VHSLPNRGPQTRTPSRHEERASPNQTLAQPDLRRRIAGKGCEHEAEAGRAHVRLEDRLSIQRRSFASETIHRPEESRVAGSSWRWR
jgi:hypothetical protein